jgi:Flp pilus assembly protein TadG
MVEFALVVVPAVVAGVALIQFAIFRHSWQVLNDSVLEGARVASAENRTVDDGVAYARQLLQVGLPKTGSTMSLDGHTEDDTVVLEGHGSVQIAIPWVMQLEVPISARAAIAKEGFKPGGRGNG